MPVPGAEPDVLGSMPSIPPMGAPPTAASGVTDPATKAAYTDYEGAEKQLEDFQGKPPQFKFDEQAPQKQQAGVMQRAPLLLALTAIGGKAFKLHGKAMLGATNGMVKGLIQGSDKAYQDAEKQYEDHYKQAMQKYQTELQLYNHGLEMYKGRVDQKLRALEFARQVNKDNQQVTWDDFNKFIMTGKLKDELERTKVMKANAGMGGAAGTGSNGLLDEDTLKLAVKLVKANPDAMRQFVPSMGAKGMPIRSQINKALAEDLKNSGMSPEDLVQLRSVAKSEGKSIDKLVQQKHAIAAFEAVARNNGQRLLELAATLDDPETPVLTAASRFLKKEGGDVDAAEFKSVLQTFQTEAARILNNPNMTGVLTDSARHELQDVISGRLNIGQLNRVVNRLFTEMDVRTAGLDEQINAAKGNLNPSVQPSKPQRTVVRTGVSASTGQKFVQYSDGTIESAK